MNISAKTFPCLQSILTASVLAIAFQADGNPDTYHVPDDFNTIQAALDAVVDGDTIIVRPGDYGEHIDFLGKAVALESEQGPAVTVIRGTDAGRVVTIENVTAPGTRLAGFTVTNGSGGIHCGDCSETVTFHQNIIEKNVLMASSGTLAGAGVYSVNSEIVFRENIIRKNVITGSHNGLGAGIYGMFTPAVLEDNVIEENAINDCFYAKGGGLTIHTDDTLTIRNNTIRNNEVNSPYSSVGAGMDFYAESGEISDNVIAHNKAMATGGSANSCHGGGIMGGGGITITRNTLTGNITYGEGNAVAYGGAIYLKSTSTGQTAVVLENQIFGDTASYLCEGIYCSGACDDVRIENNFISGHGQFGIHCASVDNAVIIGNTIIKNGGGITIHYETAIIERNLIMDNHNITGSTFGSGGIEGFDADYLRIAHNVIAGNRSTKHGGGICCAYGGMHLFNNTIIGNDALQYGGGVMVLDTDTSLILDNSILWDNKAVKGPAVFVNPSCHVEIDYCCIEGGKNSVHVMPGATGKWGIGNIDSDPFLADLLSGDFHLTYPSPCRDAGNNDALPSGPVFDFESDPRIASGTVDIGADEFFRHLYCTGDKWPGGSVEGKIVGTPGTGPLGLFFGSGVLVPPQPTAWGPFHLESPWVLIHLAPLVVPADGILEIPATLPASHPVPYDLYLQALIGLAPGSLSNLEVLEVRLF